MAKKNYQIWIEGYAATGERAGASLVGTYKAESFDEAVEMYNKDGGKAERNERNRYVSDFAYHNRPSNWNVWACNLFDNEADARKSFG